VRSDKEETMFTVRLPRHNQASSLNSTSRSRVVLRRMYRTKRRLELSFRLSMLPASRPSHEAATYLITSGFERLEPLAFPESRPHTIHADYCKEDGLPDAALLWRVCQIF
jgi:hypothetical protein